MNKIVILCTMVCLFGACTKDQPIVDEPDPGRVPTDSLLVYQSDNASSNRGIFSKSFTTGDSVLLVANSTMPYVANQRLTYIKAGKTVGYAKLNGVSKFLIDLTAPADPCLSIDARLICVVDKTADAYRLLVVDTLGNSTTLYQSTAEIKQPEFSTDGISIYFSQKNSNGNFAVFKIASTGGTPVLLATPDTGAHYTDCAATAYRLYFLQSREISGKLSTEICSVNFDGGDFQKHTDHTLNWSKAGMKMENLRKVNNSTLIFVSDYGSNNKDIYLTKTDNFSFISRITNTTANESYPSLIPAFVKDF